ncbi:MULTISPECIES: hypothetical protein [unclassified Pseudomonas]|uniref:hypothetical protein n=1 Tax=unclassified Pseudomonas TaxID=196821 RepID=UPI000B81F87E|nr:MULTISPECIES: hypothetical protein [unclassified Pseudomonas]
MAAELVPKLTDMKSLQDLAKIFALPMLAVAYIMQTGLVVSIDDTIWFSVNWEGKQAAAWLMVFFIVILKTLWMAFCGMFVHGIIGLLHTQINELVYPVSAMCLFTLGLLGLFPPEDLAARVVSVSSFWFYACFVWGFFFIAMDRQVSGD